MDVRITKMDGEAFLLSDHNIVVQDFNVGSIPVEGVYGQIEGRSGTVDYGAEMGQRSINVPFYVDAHDMLDYPLLRDKLFELTVTSEPIYIEELRRAQENEGDNELVGGKRYKVRVTGGYELDQNRTYGFGEMSFETVGLPYAESVKSTQDIQTNGLRYGDGWSYGMGLLYDEESHKYTHSSREFRIYNAGNVDIHPFEQDLRIEITGASKGYELRNVTTGSVFKLTDTVNGKVVLDGAKITDNNSQALRKTNRKYISLRKGWNSFTQTHTNEVKLNFHFYYK